MLATISAPISISSSRRRKGSWSSCRRRWSRRRRTHDLGAGTDQRTQQLVARGWSSKEQGDTDRLTAASRVAAVAVARANVVAQQAAVDRHEELTSFEQIKAPFDGVSPARNVDIGDLVNAGVTQGGLFQVADIHGMRIYVNVPQAFVATSSRG